MLTLALLLVYFIINDKKVIYFNLGCVMSLAIEKEQTWFKSLPIPREHGAWFMLYVPLMVVLVGLHADWFFTVVLVLTVTGVFWGQHTAGLVLRRRGDVGSGWWLVLYGCVSVMGAGSLLAYGLTDLLWMGIPFGLFMSWQLVRSKFARKRVDRTLSGEMVAIAGLTLTAPVAFVVCVGELTQTAIGLWGLFVLFFCSSVFYVKMRIEAVQIKAGIQWKDRLHLGSGLLFYHTILVVNLLVFTRVSEFGIFLLIGFVPVFIRALLGFVRLSNQLPKLKVVGMIESVYTLWFAGWVVVVLQMMGK